MIKDIVKGINDYFRAFSLMGKLKLWKYVVLTGLLSLIFGGLLIFLSIAMINIFSSTIIGIYPFDFGKDYVISIAKFISGISTAILGLMLYKYIVFIIFVPFLGPISEKIEEHLTGVKSGYSVFNIPRLIKDVLRGLRISIRLVYKELIWVILLFILSFFPLFSPFVPIVAFIVEAFYGGYGNFDWALERYYNVKERVAFIRYNKGLTLGNGIPFTLMLSIPVIGFFLAPALSVAAATISVVERIKRQE
jgi:CysZ protein